MFIKKIEYDYKINELNRKIKDAIDERHNIITEYSVLQEKYKNLQKENEGLSSRYKEGNHLIDRYRTTINDNKKVISTLENQLQEQKEVNDKYVQDYRDVINRESILKDAYKNTKEQMDKEIQLANKLTVANMEKDKIIDSQQAVINAMTRNEFDKDNIEFAAIKTYRGWICVYRDGKKLDISDAEYMNVTWYKDGDSLEVTVQK